MINLETKLCWCKRCCTPVSTHRILLTTLKVKWQVQRRNVCMAGLFCFVHSKLKHWDAKHRCFSPWIRVQAAFIKFLSDLWPRVLPFATWPASKWPSAVANWWISMSTYGTTMVLGSISTSSLCMHGKPAIYVSCIYIYNMCCKWQGTLWGCWWGCRC